MKKVIVAALLAASSSAFACSFHSYAAPEIREITRKNGGFPVTDSQCEFLSKNGLGLAVSGNATVISNASVAWVNVKLIDNKYNVVSNEGRQDTKLNAKQASQDLAESLFFQALTEAIQRLDFVKAGREVSAALAARKCGSR